MYALQRADRVWMRSPSARYANTHSRPYKSSQVGVRGKRRGVRVVGKVLMFKLEICYCVKADVGLCGDVIESEAMPAHVWLDLRGWSVVGMEGVKKKEKGVRDAQTGRIR